MSATSSRHEGLTNEQRHLIRHKQTKADPRFYMKYFWSHPNRQSDNYDFRTNDGKRELQYLLDDRGPLNPNEWADINIFNMARGCLKTTTTLGITNWALDKFPVEFYMAAPTEKPPITEYVDKFENIAHDTPLYDSDRVVKESLGHHKFKKVVQNENGNRQTLYSALKTQTAYNPDRLRGPHCHGGILDEFQDVSQESFTMFLQMIDQGLPNESSAPFPVVFLIGTPKEKNTLFHQLWTKSNQRTWDGETEEWIDESDVGAFEVDDDDEDESDDKVDEIDSYTIKGWHIDQHNSPLASHNPSKIEFNKQTYSERQFKNECLAEFYSPEDDLLSDEDVKASFAADIGFRYSRKAEDSKVVLTADWGGGSGKDAADTVFTAGELIEDPERFIETEAYLEARENDIEVPYQIHILNHKFIDHAVSKPEEESMFREWIDAYAPTSVCIDQGHNGSRRSRLRSDYGELITGVKYGNVSPPTEIRWKENELEEPIIANVDKTHVCEKFVDAFKDGRFVIPAKGIGNPERRGSVAQKLISQLSAPFEEQKKTATGSKRLYVQSDRNDDSFDTFAYQFVGHDFINPLKPNISANQLEMRARAGY